MKKSSLLFLLFLFLLSCSNNQQKGINTVEESDYLDYSMRDDALSGGVKNNTFIEFPP